MAQCTHCGARLLPFQNLCDFCGAQLEGDPAPDGPAGDAYERLADNPELARVLAEGPRKAAPSQRKERPQMMLVLFFAAAVLALMLAWEDGLPSEPRDYLLPGLLLLPLVLRMFRKRGRARAYSQSQLEAFPARIGSVEGPNAGGGARGHVLLETRGGQRRNLQPNGTLWAEITEGDMGAAFVKGNILVDFRRVPA